MQRGGGETFDLEISAQLAQMGCGVTLLTGWPILREKPKEVTSSPSSIARCYIRSPYLPWFPWDKVKAGWRVRVWEFQQFEKKAASWIQKHQSEFDVIQICELPYLVSLLKSKIKNQKSKIVIRLTAPNAHDPWGGIQMADAVIASGTSIAIIRKSIRVDVHDVPNAVDCSRFKKAQENEQSAFRQRYSIPVDVPVLLYVARFQDFKNHRLLLDAFALVLEQHPEVRLVLAGSGPLLRDLETKAEWSKIKERVIFLGEVLFDELPAIYATADIKVISSNYESFCFAAIEAMAAGLPLVTTDCGWVPRLIGDTWPPVERQWYGGDDPPERFGGAAAGERIREAPGGLIVGRNDPESLAKANLRMLADPELVQRCGKWNREKAVREHGWESSARKLLSLYERLTGIKKQTTEGADKRGSPEPSRRISTEKRS